MNSPKEEKREDKEKKKIAYVASYFVTSGRMGGHATSDQAKLLATQDRHPPTVHAITFACLSQPLAVLDMLVTQHASESLLRCMIRFLALFDLYGPHAVSDPLRSSNNHPSPSSQTVQSPALLPQNSPGMRAVLLIRTIIMSSPRSTDGSVDQWDKCSTQSGHLARRVRRSKYAYHSAHRNNDPRGAQFYSRKS